MASCGSTAHAIHRFGVPTLCQYLRGTWQLTQSFRGEGFATISASGVELFTHDWPFEIPVIGKFVRGPIMVMCTPVVEYDVSLPAKLASANR